MAGDIHEPLWQNWHHMTVGIVFRASWLVAHGTLWITYPDWS